MNITIRKATISDLEILTKLTMILYEARDYDYLWDENNRLLNSEYHDFFLAFDEKQEIAFAHTSLRLDYVECTSSSPVGYLEGIFVLPEYRKQGLAGQLVKVCENWAKENGCTEFASDCELDNEDSYKFHLKIGFVEASKNIHFTKGLRVIL